MEPNDNGKFFLGSLLIFFFLFIFALIVLISAQNAVKNVVQVETSQYQLSLAEQRLKELDTAENLTPGQEIVKDICSRCHRAGLMGAPQLANAKDWSPRIDKGIDKLYHSALNGYNKMPARGGRSKLDDNQVKAAVDYMVSLAKEMAEQESKL